MSLTDRDKKILIVIVPVLLLVGYWFLLLGPKRQEASKAQDQLSQAQEEQRDAEQQLSQLKSARTTFAADYSELVRLGKAIPTTVDVPTLIVQLDTAARGTGIDFKRIAAVEGGATGATSPAPPAAPGGGESAPAAPGGTPAASTPGQQTEGAGEAVNAANAQNTQNAEASGVASGDTQTSTSSGNGVPVGGGSSSASAAADLAAGGCAPGLVCMPLEFEFTGGFFELADFFHRLKRFVRVVNDDVLVGGRLMTVEGLKFSSGEELFPSVKAEVKATVYLSPEAQGATAGATPQGPAETVPASTGTPPPGPSTATPTATATP